MDATTFRADFPEFASTTVYPDSSIAFWLNVSQYYLSETVFVGMYPYAQELFVAHNLAQSGVARAAAASGGVPGGGVSGGVGVVASKSLEKGSISYDTAASTIKDAGNWNATAYGVRLYDLILRFGAGGMQL